MRPVNHPLEAQIAERVLAYVLEPPTGDDPVIEHAAPDEIIDLFEATVGLGLPDAASGHDPADMLEAVDQVIERSVHTSHPRFLNQNFAGPDPVAVVGDFLGAALNTTGATFEAAPVFTLMESAVLHKLARLAGYVEGRSEPVPALPPGLFCPGGSTATLYALQLARHRLRPDVNRTGATGERLVLFVSAAGHYAAGKSAAMLGLGTDAVIEVDTDDAGAIRPDALRRAIGAAEEAGSTPFAVIGTAGTTVTSAFDDLHSLADICEDHALWLHVDGCYGGSALFSSHHRRHLSGVERSDSFVWNLHKMLGITQQCTALLVKNPAQLAPCFAGHADYLFQPDKLHADFDSGDRTFQCARRVDALKLWLTWKVRGDHEFAQRIDHACDMAAHTRRAIDASGGAFVPLVRGGFTNVVFAWVPPDLRPIALDAVSIEAIDPDVRNRLHSLPPQIKAEMQREGTAMLGYQPVHGLNSFRLLFMNPTVQPRDIDAVLGHIDRYGSALATR